MRTMAKHMQYWDYSAQQDSPVHCPKCGWSGLPGNYTTPYTDLFDVCCPQCREMLLIVTFPTVEETREAAVAGNEEAAAELPRMEAQVEAMRRRYGVLLRSTDELPDLSDERLVVEWDMERADDGEHQTVLRVGEREIWREFAFWEGITRFEQVVEVLRDKYGRRLVEVRPTRRSQLYLLGDDFYAPKTVERINDALRSGEGNSAGGGGTT
ncbi:hypothetical protein [Mycolicibacterium thermoresistibile]